MKKTEIEWGNSLESVSSLPKVAILGSPNVGKSTLFNRLLGRRRAITDPTPGVTRDPVEAKCVIDDASFLLVDTGGYLEGADEEVTEIASRKSLELAREADLLLFVVEVAGLAGNDEIFAQKLRPYAQKLILVVNKVDNAAREAQIWEFLRIGYDRMIAVSAAHGRNLVLLKQEIVSYLADLPAAKVRPGTEAFARIAILGKPNTGKSTLLNQLTGENRSIVLEQPGTTRDVIEGKFIYRDKEFQVLDTAGIRKKTKIKGRVEHYSVSQAIRAVHQTDLVFLLIDAVTGLTDQDKKIAAHVVKEGKGIVLVLNKWDLLQDIPNRLQAVKDRISFLFPILGFAPVIAISAQTGYGIKRLLDTSMKVMAQLHRRISTSPLNKELEEWVKENPPSYRGQQSKVRYGTQVSCNPVFFVFFVSRVEKFPSDYSKYLTNKIRSTFGFNMIPVSVEMRGG